MTWTQTQWNCIARCGNIDGLAFRNFKEVADANPEDWLMCQWTELALHCALQKEAIGANKNGFIYFKEGTKDGLAAKTYQEALHGIVNQSKERVNAVRQHCQVGYFNAYGLCKGAASHATSGTT
jgi:hypothetical protein